MKTILVMLYSHAFNGSASLGDIEKRIDFIRFVSRNGIYQLGKRMKVVRQNKLK